MPKAQPVPQPLCQGLEGQPPCVNYADGACPRLRNVLTLHGPDQQVTACGGYEPQEQVNNGQSN